jgi:hypothetical protein
MNNASNKATGDGLMHIKNNRGLAFHIFNILPNHQQVNEIGHN